VVLVLGVMEAWWKGVVKLGSSFNFRFFFSSHVWMFFHHFLLLFLRLINLCILPCFDYSSNLTFSLAPGWAFIDSEDWRKDIQCAWSGCGGDFGMLFLQHLLNFIVLSDIDTYAFCFVMQTVGYTLMTCGSAHGLHLIFRVVGALRGGGGG